MAHGWRLTICRVDVDAVQQRHPNVENGDVRGAFLTEAHGFTPVTGLANHLPVGLRLKNLAQPLPDDGVILAEKESSAYPSST